MICPTASPLNTFFLIPQSEQEKKKEAKQREREAREKEARKREKAEEKEKRRKEYNAQMAAVAAREQQKKKSEEKKKKNGQAAGGTKGLDDASLKGIVHVCFVLFVFFVLLQNYKVKLPPPTNAVHDWLFEMSSATVNIKLVFYLIAQIFSSMQSFILQLFSAVNIVFCVLEKDTCCLWGFTISLFLVF